MRFEPKRVLIRITVEGDDWHKSLNTQHAFTWDELKLLTSDQVDVVLHATADMWEEPSRAMRQ